MDYFRNTDEKEGLRDIRADQIAVVGDRLLTDMCLANEMGSWGIWVKEGVVDLKSKSVVSLNRSHHHKHLEVNQTIISYSNTTWPHAANILLTAVASSLRGWSKGSAHF
jgi:ribonucleotide monophosphatase NagD (HAD superfamily)